MLADAEERVTYVISPRPKRVFHTVLDAAELIAPDRSGRSTSVTRVTRHRGTVRLELSLEQRFVHGTLREGSPAAELAALLAPGG